MRCIGRWFIGETLGKGGYSWVKKGYDKQTGKAVALKFMTKADSSWADEQTRQVITEIEALKQIRHPNVMKLYAYNLNAKYPQKSGENLDVILLVLEYAPGGELFDILYYTSALDEDVARTYFRQMVVGLEACHKSGIAHRDVKPQNLLLDANFNLKITDFGLSKVFESDADTVMHTTYVGTRGYQAPELLLNRPYTVTCDIFSAGVVLFILLTGYPPFEQASKSDRWYKPLAKQEIKKFWKAHRGCGISSLAKDLLTQMLAFQPTKRITVEQIKQHPWYKGPVLNSQQLVQRLRVRHREMEIKRRNDAKKKSDLAHSQVRRGAKLRLLPGESPDHDLTKLLAPKVKEESAFNFNDIHTSETPYNILKGLNDYFFDQRVKVDFEESECMLIASGAVAAVDTEGPKRFVRMSIQVLRDDKQDCNLVRFKRVQGDWMSFKHLYTTTVDNCAQYIYGGQKDGETEDAPTTTDAKTIEKTIEKSVEKTLEPVATATTTTAKEE